MLLRGNSRDGYKRDGLKQDYQRFITQVGKEIAEVTGDQQKKARLDARLSQYNDALLDSNSLLPCGVYVLEKAWLSSFKVSDLNYAQGNQLVYLDATFYADNIVDLTV
jgi:protein-disulfide isomerase-like protein with CxxC motif